MTAVKEEYERQISELKLKQETISSALCTELNSIKKQFEIDMTTLETTNEQL